MKILVIGDLHGKVSEKLKREISKKEFDFIIGVGDYSGVREWYPYIKHIFKNKKPKMMKSAEEFFGKKKFKEILKKDFKAGKESLFFLDRFRKPGFFVFGNADEGWYNYPFSNKNIGLRLRKKESKFLKKIKNLKEITYKLKNRQGISFLGFGGYMDVSANEKARDKEWQEIVNKRNQKAEKKMWSLTKKLKSKSVFVFHYPPKGIFDIIKDKSNPFNGGSSGIDFFRKAVLKHKPSLVLCGHMEEYQGKKKLGSSWVVNPGEGAEGKFAIVDINDKKGKIRKIEFYK